MSSHDDSAQKEHEISLQRFGMYSQLFQYGDFIPLRFKIDIDQVEKELKVFDDMWKPYNPNKGDRGRLGLSVTSLDGKMSGYPDLHSIYEYSKETGHKISENDFNQLTEVYEKVPSIREVLDYFKPHLGRSRFIKFRAGGHFPPHRDQSVSFFTPDYYRLLVPLSNTGKNQFFIIYDDKVIPYEPGRVYLFNALKVHTVFSVTDEAMTLALSVNLNPESVKKVLRSLETN